MDTNNNVIQNEMIAWWSKFENQIFRMSEFEKKKVEDNTGCVPLILTAFFNSGKECFEETWKKYSNIKYVKDVCEQLENFSYQKKLKGGYIWEW